MKYILLCGGIGKRCNNYSLPKPLNFINGKHMIEYIIQNIPSEELYVIYNVFLEDYNFEEIVRNLFKTKTIYFSKVDYLTRGAVETAYIGINQFHLGDSPVVFMDNDNIHTFTEFPNSNFVGHGINYEKTNYSFIEILDGFVVNIEEKVKISDNYCCGIYGFQNTNIFQKYAKQLIEQNFKTKNEFYFSQLYKLLLKEHPVTPVLMETNHIGSYDEIMAAFGITDYQCEKLRFCFDLDNTLVTFPTIPNDYTTVKPIHKMINTVQTLKKAGHEIIIYTARRMKTHEHNIGKIIKDIALITLNTLEQFNIPYDELVFGKPIADIYVDDRSINPYCNDISFFGLFNEKNDFLHNRVENNKFNKIKKKENIITKNGPKDLLKGELFFYQNIPIKLLEYFPKFHGHEIREEMIILMEHINGIPLCFLYKNHLLNEKHINELFQLMSMFHTSGSITIKDEKIYRNYFDKLKFRYESGVYSFEDSEEIYKNITDGLKKHYAPEKVGIIHGDFWFSNILLDYNDNYKCIDMRGQVDDELTLNGDKYYDYAKLYQSILGYDLVLSDSNFDHEYFVNMNISFLKQCEEVGLNIPYLKSVTHSLIFGNIFFIDSFEKRVRVWDFLKKIKKSE
jgi:capsule biosynthesis phosphatase